jgi:hypothetical protein
MPTLLEKAKATPAPRMFAADVPLTDEHIELMFAYLNNEITVRQGSAALGAKHPGNFSQWFGKNLVKLYREKKIRIERNAN